MLQRKIANRYAKAIFDLAVEKGKTEKWETELVLVSALFSSTTDLIEFLTHPEIPLTRKEALLDKILEESVSREVKSLFLMLLRRGHAPDAALIHEIYLDYWNKLRNILPVTVTSATPLSDEQTQKLANALAIRTGSNIKLKTEINPEILAGMIIRLGDRVIDASAKTALDEMLAAMAGK
jgi:F-type H+-transporting ATPase subunit delta